MILMIPSSRILKLILWCIIITEVIVLTYLRSPWMVGDTAHYIELSRNMLTGNNFSSMTPDGLMPEALRSPGYPIFLGIFIFLNFPIWVIIIIQMLMYIWCLRMCEKHLISNDITRVWFFVVAAIYIFPVIYCLSISSEALTLFLVVGSVTCSIKRKPLLAGSAAGFAILVRGDMLLLPFLAALMLWHYVGRKQALTSLLSVIIVLLPYGVWNYTTFGKFSPIPLASPSGQSVLIATWESRLKLDYTTLVNSGPDSPAARSGYLAQVSKNNALADRMAREGPYHRRQAEIIAPEIFMETALGRIRNDPADFVMHTTKAFWRLFNTASIENVPSFAGIILKVISGTIWGLAVFGFALAFLRTREKTLMFIGAVVMALLVVHLPLHTEARYTTPSRLFLMISAASALTYLASGFRRFVRPSPPCDNSESTVSARQL